jgi:hypothetical protein
LIKVNVLVSPNQTVQNSNRTVLQDFAKLVWFGGRPVMT